jgi:hypothetical protein
VTDLDAAVSFYSKLFATEPAKIKPGYANFAIADPPLKLVLLQSAEGGTLNHLGVETETATEVVAAEARLTDTGLATTGVADTVCCFAEKVETWVNDPDGAPWEWYVKTADSDDNAGVELDEPSGTVCCATPASAPVALGSKPGIAPPCS